MLFYSTKLVLDLMLGKVFYLLGEISMLFFEERLIFHSFLVLADLKRLKNVIF